MAAFDIYSPQQMGHVVRRMTEFANAMPKEMVESSRNWYHEAHDVASKAGSEFNIPTKSAAGMMAALSAGTDWEVNKRSFQDILSMPEEHRAIVQRSSMGKGRSREASDLLKQHYVDLSTATDRNILRAMSIHKGADPEKVMPLSTAPKYNAFYRNIADPESDDVVVDFRAFDLVSNEMRPQRDFDRGISKGDPLKRGRHPYQPNLPRYQRVADVYRRAAQQSDYGFTRPNQFQAVTWVGGKAVETSLPTSTGGQRVKGMSRKGQPYMEKSGRPIDYGRLGWSG